MEYERQPLGRGQCLEDQEQRQSHRVGLHGLVLGVRPLGAACDGLRDPDRLAPGPRERGGWNRATSADQVTKEPDNESANDFTSEPKERSMTEGMRTIIYPVTGMAQAKGMYAALLGVAPSTDEPWYVAFDVGGQHVGLDPRGHSRGMTGPVGYWHVGDIETTLASLLAAGATVQQEITDVGGARLIASVKDGDGNVTGLIQDR